jgi:hypothetical protein
MWFPAADTVALSTDGDERVRILSTGSVLFGQSLNDRPAEFTQPTGASIAGATGHLHGQYQSSVSGLNMLLNRKGSDGSIIEFRKDGTAVGSIGTVDGDFNVHASASGHKGLRFGNGFIAPTSNSTTIEDATTDLGLSTHRFKDLYLSGNVSAGAGTVSAPAITTTGDTNTGIFFPAADTIAFSEGGAEAMRIDSSGNLGLGVTPSASWSSGFRAFQIAGQGAGLSVSTSVSQIWLSSNGIYNGSNWLYANSATAGQYQIDGNAHKFFTAPSGTAGDAISFTQAMTLDASGNLGIGTTSPGTELDVNGDITADGIYLGGTVAANYLDDYEEGTFTPVLTGSTSGTFNGSGKYTKIGDVVNVYMQFASITTANKPIGDYTITGLPFTSRATVPDSTALTIGLFARVTFDASKVLSASIDANTTTVTLSELVTNGLGTAVTDANFVNAGPMFFRINGSYPTST